MRKKYSGIASCVIFFAVIIIFPVFCILKPDEKISVDERRQLAVFPEFSAKNIKNGSFMNGFDKYISDHFPMRRTFRTGKALNEFMVYRKKDNNDIYFSDGYAAKLDYKADEASLDYACRRFSYVYEKYLKDGNNRVFLSIIPDKNYFLSVSDGTPSMDYGMLVEKMTSGMPYARYIDIFPTLELEDYYRTDTHWKQEKITDTAMLIAEKMNFSISGDFSADTPDADFYGVYFGQTALPVKPEKISLLTNPTIESLSVFNYETGETTGVYDMSKAEGADLYEIYLSGPRSLMTIKNPLAENDRELIVFRDSFGSSIAPLLAEGFSSVTLADIRYIAPDALKNFAEFQDIENKDILFLYSTLILNDSDPIK